MSIRITTFQGSNFVIAIVKVQIVYAFGIEENRNLESVYNGLCLLHSFLNPISKVEDFLWI